MWASIYDLKAHQCLLHVSYGWLTWQVKGNPPPLVNFAGCNFVFLSAQSHKASQELRLHFHVTEVTFIFHNFTGHRDRASPSPYIWEALCGAAKEGALFVGQSEF